MISEGDNKVFRMLLWKVISAVEKIIKPTKEIRHPGWLGGPQISKVDQLETKEKVTFGLEGTGRQDV